MKIFIKTSSNLNIYWNLGSLLMMMMPIQVLIGFILSMTYFFNSIDMFNNSFFIFMNLNYGWFTRICHSNLTSLIFIISFIHMLRSMMYKNLINQKMWYSGMIMLVILMLISFLGYSLINSQMAFWASMVITNFIATIPILGHKIMLLIWGNHYIDNLLLNRFFSMHFMSAILILMISILHMIILHMNKSTNPLNINNNIDQINLNPLLIFKDLILMIMFLYLMTMINLLMPMKMNNPDNFNPMMMFKTPNHIEPEWYFLFFYSILRSINNKFNGLMLMLLSICILFSLPMIFKTNFISNKFSFINKILLMMMILNITLIAFLGSKPTKYPFSLILKYLIMIYFYNFIIFFMTSKLINKI